MADSKPIKYSQIAEPNLLGPLKKELEEVNNLLGITEKNLKKMVEEAAKLAKQTPLDSYKNLGKVQKGIDDTTKTVKELDKIEKDRIRLQERINQLDDERAQANFDLREQIRRQTKELRDNAKATADVGDAYEKLKKETNDAQKEFKRLAAEFGVSSKQAEEARKTFNRLDDQLREINDAAKDGRRDVGRYEKAAAALNKTFDAFAYEKLKKETDEAQKEFKRLAAEFGVNSKQAEEVRKEFKRLDGQLREINDAAKDGRRDIQRYEKGVASLTKAFKAFASATIILKVLDLLQTQVQNNSDGAAELEKIWVRVTATFQVISSRLVEAFQVLTASFEAFTTRAELGLAKLQNVFGRNQEEVDRLQRQYDDLSKNGRSLTDVFAGMGDEIADLIDKKVKLVDDTLQYRREIVDLESDIADLIPTQEKLRAQFENSTASLEEQITAGVAFRKELQSRQQLEEQIAARRLQLAQQNAAANRVSVEAQEELAAATLEYNQLIADQAAELAATEREIQQLRDDATQLNLDFYIDDFDNRKTVNERIIADETQTFERRRQLLDENLRLTEESFNLEEEALNKSLAERGKAQLDFDELRQKSSSEEIARIIRESGISEPLAIRALEVLRERRTFLQDNAEAQRDLNDAEAESARLQDDIILQQEALNRLQARGVDMEKVLQDLADARLQSEIDNLREQIAVTEEASARFIALNQELNDKLIEQNQVRSEKQKEQLQEFAQAANESFQILSDLANRRAEQRIDAIDEEIDAEERRIDRLRELAEQGNEDAQNNLAIAAQRQAQLELERERQLQRQKQSELALTAIQTYSGKVTAGEANPLASTISDISVLRAFVASLPGFYEGTEDTGTAGPLRDQYGTITGYTHENERVLKAEQNRLIGDLTNAELTMIAHRHNTGHERQQTDDRLLREIQELKEVTKNRPVYLGSDYNEIDGLITHKIRKGRKLEKTHRKSGSIWG